MLGYYCLSSAVVAMLIWTYLGLIPINAVNKGMFWEAVTCLYSEYLCKCSVCRLGIECPGPDLSS